MIHKVPSEICSLLVKDKLIKKNLKSVIWFGSLRNNQEVHKKSDYDIQIIMDRSSPELSLRLNKILAEYPSVDLSIMYMHDIFNENGEVVFHDGTKGSFFIYVLAAGQVLYGKNIYSPVVKHLSHEDVRPSLLLTIREYISRLRVMAAQSPDDTLLFKKYSLKLFKDVLLYWNRASVKEMSSMTSTEVCKGILVAHNFNIVSKKAIKEITRYEHSFSGEEMAYLLDDYEKMIQRILNA